MLEPILPIIFKVITIEQNIITLKAWFNTNISLKINGLHIVDIRHIPDRMKEEISKVNQLNS